MQGVKQSSILSPARLPGRFSLGETATRPGPYSLLRNFCLGRNVSFRKTARRTPPLVVCWTVPSQALFPPLPWTYTPLFFPGMIVWLPSGLRIFSVFCSGRLEKRGLLSFLFFLFFPLGGTSLSLGRLIWL